MTRGNLQRWITPFLVLLMFIVTGGFLWVAVERNQQAVEGYVQRLAPVSQSDSTDDSDSSDESTDASDEKKSLMKKSLMKKVIPRKSQVMLMAIWKLGIKN